MRDIARQIKDYQSAKLEKKIHIFFVPQRKLMCEKILEEEGAFECALAY